jgi:hypothetical protein
MTATPVHFCTYFDSRYLSRGLALYESLQRHAAGSRLHVLCMDDIAWETLDRLALPNVDLIRLRDFEQNDADLQLAKTTRSIVEYYFTCTPSLPLYILRRNPDLERVFYVDADIYFFSSISAILEEMGRGSVYIVKHRFPRELRWLERWGQYNVGILGFSNDAAGLRCLESWRSQCLAWCYDRFEDGKFADQKYLDAWPESQAGVVVSEHPGVNLAPWNKTCYRLETIHGVPHVAGRPVVCYHFHGLKLFQSGIVVPQWNCYGTKLGRRWLMSIYRPYLDAVARLEQGFGLNRHEDLRQRRPLSWADLSRGPADGQLLLRSSTRLVEIPGALLLALRLGRKAIAAARTVLDRLMPFGFAKGNCR